MRRHTARYTTPRDTIIVVYDLGPSDPAEREAWGREIGLGAVRVSTHQHDIVELGRGRYAHRLPAGMTVSHHVILS